MRTAGQFVGLLVIATVLVASAPGLTSPAAAGRVKEVTDEPYPAEFRAKVRKAIQEGIRYVREEQLAAWGYIDESHLFEEAAAVMWVLRRAGVALDDPATAYQFRVLHMRSPETVGHACLLLLALCARPLPEGDPFSILEHTGTSSTPAALSEKDQALATKMVELLLDMQVMDRRYPPELHEHLSPEILRSEPHGGWLLRAKPSGPKPSGGVVGTYLAVLALEAAVRCGIEVPEERFRAALGFFLRAQTPKGRRTTLRMNEVRRGTRLEWTVKAKARGFGYSSHAADKPTGYETAAGAIGLVVCKDALRGEDAITGKLRKRVESAILDALAWIQKHYTVKENPDPRGRGEHTKAIFHHHWLQGLARLAIHTRMRFIGKHDWYREGAEMLLEKQLPDGSWHAIWWSNCYALLFLQRASLTSVAPVITPGER